MKDNYILTAESVTAGNRVAELVRMACCDGLSRQDVFIFHASIFLSSAD